MRATRLPVIPVEPVPLLVSVDADLERRFGGLRRLYGDATYACIRAAHVVVVGVGGVGSWAAEALARSGVAALTLIDLDQVSESNINRQIQALGSTVGQAKVDALRRRVADIHPACEVVGHRRVRRAGQLARAAREGRAAGRCRHRCL
jgi:tRNA A37 threonylcarbamoyladenosine dehydratase